MRTLAISRSTRDRAKDGVAGSTVIDTAKRSYAGLPVVFWGGLRGSGTDN
jgi:hypothetical protein